MPEGYRLPPFLREALGGSTGLVNLGERHACDQVSYPDDDASLALLDATGAASQTTVLNDNGKHHPIAEVAGLLKRELQLLVRAKPFLNEATDCRVAFEDVPAQRPAHKDRIHSKAAHHRIDITAIRSLKRPAHKLNQVGGRGLLGHRPVSIPPSGSRRRLHD
jgi:hypothetical protein